MTSTSKLFAGSTLSMLMLAACGTSASDAGNAMANDSAQAVAASNTANATVAALSPDGVAEEANAAPTTPLAPAGTRPMSEPVLGPAPPGTPGGLPDDRTPISEGPIDPKSPQGAAQVVQSYAAFIEAGRYGEAYALWGHRGADSGMTRAQFAAAFDKYAEVHGQVGAPTDGDGAAGSVYVTVPLQLYGTLKKSNRRFVMTGPVTLRRVNDVDGASPEQLRWHISTTALKPIANPG